jgi:hypothetical protein
MGVGAIMDMDGYTWGILYPLWAYTYGGLSLQVRTLQARSLRGVSLRVGAVWYESLRDARGDVRLRCCITVVGEGRLYICILLVRTLQVRIFQVRTSKDSYDSLYSHTVIQNLYFTASLHSSCSVRPLLARSLLVRILQVRICMVT